MRDIGMRTKRNEWVIYYVTGKGKTPIQTKDEVYEAIKTPNGVFIIIRAKKGQTPADQEAVDIAKTFNACGDL